MEPIHVSDLCNTDFWNMVNVGIEKKGICLYLNEVEGVEKGINTSRWFFSA